MIVGNARKQPNTVPIQPSKSTINVNGDSNIPKDKEDNNVVNNNPRPSPPSSAQAQIDLARVQPPLKQDPSPLKQEPPPPRQEPPPPRQESPPPKQDIQQQQQPQPPPPKPQNDKKENDIDTPNPDSEQEGGKPKFPHGKPDEIDIMVVEATSGPKPQTTSKVEIEIEYKGFLPNGDEFISHREEILLGKRQNIKDLELRVCSMTVGSKVKLWIPSKLGYGPKVLLV